MANWNKIGSVGNVGSDRNTGNNNTSNDEKKISRLNKIIHYLWTIEQFIMYTISMFRFKSQQCHHLIKEKC